MTPNSYKGSYLLMFALSNSAQIEWICLIHFHLLVISVNLTGQLLISVDIISPAVYRSGPH